MCVMEWGENAIVMKQNTEYENVGQYCLYVRMHDVMFRYTVCECPHSFQPLCVVCDTEYKN